MVNFYSILRLSSRSFLRSDNFLANFCKNSWVVSVRIVLLVSILCCWRPYCAVRIHIVLFAYILCCWVSILCCWRPCCASTVVGYSLYYFWHAVAGGLAVIGLPAVEGVLAVSSVPANPGVPILAGGFTYWILEWDISTIKLTNYGYRAVTFFCYRTIRISNIVLANSRNYQTFSDQGLNLSDYWISDSEKQTVAL